MKKERKKYIRSMKKLVYVDVAIYNSKVVAFFGPYDDFVSAMKKRFGIDYDKIHDKDASDRGFVHYVSNGNDAMFHVMWIDEGQTLSTLVHELLHLTGAILEQHGVKYTKDNDEPWCYLIGYLYEQLHKEIQPRKA